MWATATIIFVVLAATKPIHCLPISPCPMNFHYEFDGSQWFGIAKIYPQIYNRFRTDKITLNLTLVINRHIPNVQNFRLLELRKSIPDTYHDIATRQPIIYRINFPFRNEFPELLKMQVNGIQICRNHRVFFVLSQINLQYTFYLPTVQSEENNEDLPANDYDYDYGGQFNQNRPSVIMQRVDDDEDAEIKKSPRWKHRLLTTTQGCGKYDEKFQYKQLISGGEKISRGTWPWLVAIFHKDKQTNDLVFQCTGNLISNKAVVTAAHCFKMYPQNTPAEASEIVLVFGRYDLRDWTEQDTVTSGITEIILNPDYLSNKETKIFDADIAILITKDFIAYNSVIKPICLWPSEVDSTHNIIGTNGTLVGWGQPHENSEMNMPRRLSLPIVRNQKCFPTEATANGRYPKRRVFCAGNKKPGHAPCAGDSGSGFAIHANGAWFLRGIVSAALGDPILNQCNQNTYVIFSDILYFREFIESHM